ncbi:MAG: hypothetical protein Q7Q71_16100 [Verrucomicrobiota bacterium JB023]|nr:hypothetical protein [Verrucomicrobiota bacterium JB023]
MKKTIPTLTATVASMAFQANAQSVLYEHTFDEVDNDSTPALQGLSNGVGGATPDLLAGVAGGGGSSATGFNTVAPLDLSAVSGFTIEFIVENSYGAVANSGLNGTFFGLTSSPFSNLTTGSALYNNAGTANEGGGTSLGLQVGPARGDAGADIVLDEVNGTGTFTAAGAPAEDGTDGYTLFITYTPDEATGDTNVQVNSTGLVPDLNFSLVVPTNYADLAAEVTPNVSSQNGSVDLASIRITEVDDTDTDEDGMLDSYELIHGLDINVDDSDIDSDMDGLTNLEEFENVPRLPASTPDADNDGLLDGEEVEGTLNPYQAKDAGTAATTAPGLPTDPLNDDSDGDGLLDGEELLNNNGSVTNPFTDDTDNDLLLDGFEVANSLDPTDGTGENGEFGDPDGDTVDNYNEMEFGLDPNDPDTDGDGLNDGGDFSQGQVGELDTSDSLFPLVITDPADPDTDDDSIQDGEEVFEGDDGFVTDPVSVDSDGDGFPDPYEILAGTDPSTSTGASETPSYADVTWSVEAIDDYDNNGSPVLGGGLDTLRVDGTLLYAENYNGSSTEVNGVPFTAVGNENTPRSSDNVLTLLRNHSGQNFYTGATSPFNALLDTIFFQGDGGASDPTSALFLLTGLTVGEDYFVQLGVADDRGGSRIDRYVVAGDSFGGNDATALVGPDNTIFGGPDNPGLMLTGEFTATSETQQISVVQLDSEGFPTAVQLQFLQVRIDDGSVPGEAGISVVSSGFDGSSFAIEFTNLAIGTEYELRRSSSLDFNSPDATPDSLTAGSATETFTDSSPPSGSSFYQLFEVQN